MIENQQVALIIPFFNEAQNIAEVILTIPGYVDIVILINDGSTDDGHQVVLNAIQTGFGSSADVTDSTLEKLLRDLPGNRLSLETKPMFFILNHSSNKGKGAGVKSGYLLARFLGVECVATMDGDGQMDPGELYSICRPIIDKQADYVKGNRLAHPEAVDTIPYIRLVGIYVLAFFTRLCSGYYIQDAQSGYTSISIVVLRKIEIEDIYDKYGYVNDVIIRLSMIKGRVLEVPITPIYRDDRQSKMNVLAVIPKISLMMFRLFLLKRKHKRVGEKIL